MIKSVIYGEKSNTADINTLLNDPQDKDATFKNDRFRDEMKYLIKFLDNRGALDIVIS